MQDVWCTRPHRWGGDRRTLRGEEGGPFGVLAPGPASNYSYATGFSSAVVFPFPLFSLLYTEFYG